MEKKTNNKRISLLFLERLKNRNQDWNDFADLSSDAFILLDSNLNIARINSTAGKIFAALGQDVIGKNIVDVIPDIVNTGRYDKYLNVIKTGEPFLYSDIVPHPELGDLHLSIKAFKVHNGLGLICRDITATSRMEEALQANEETFKTIVDTSLDGIYQVNTSGEFEFINESFARTFGYRREELLGKHFSSLLSAETTPKVAKMVEAVLAGQNVKGEVFVRHKDGHEVTVDFSATPLRIDGKIIGVTGILRDVTERKRLEQMLRQKDQNYRLLFDNTLDSIFVIDAETLRPVLANQAGIRMAQRYGVSSAEELYSINVLDYIHPDDRDRALRIVAENTIGEKHGQTNEFRVIAKDGTELWLSAVGTMTEYQGRLAGLISIRDVTEQKRAEQALQQNKEQLRSVLENSSDTIYRLNLVTNTYDYVSPALRALLGYSPEEYMALSLEEALNLVHPEDRSMLLENCWNFITHPEEKEKYSRIEYRALHRELGYRWLSDSRSVIYDSQNASIAVIGNVRDITEQKRMEEALRESENRFRTIFERSGLGIGLVDANGRPTSINPALQQMLGYTIEELRSMAFTDYMPPDDATADMKLFKELIAGKRDDYTIEKRYIRKDRRMVWGKLTLTAVRNPDGTFKFAIAIVEDITKSKLAEEALKVSEEKYRALVDTAGMAGEGIMIAERSHAGDAIITFANEHLANMLGYRVEEMIGMLARSLFLPGDRIWLHDKHKRKRKGEALPNHYGVMAVRKDGSLVPIEMSMGAMQYQGKSATVVYIRDVTERKKAEEALRETRSYLENLLDHANAPIVVWDQNFKITRFNRAFEHLTGYMADEVIGRELTMLFPKSNGHQLLNEIARTLTGEHWESVEIPILRKDGEVRLVLWNSANIYADDGVTLLATIAQGTDITERKRAEDALHKSEARFRSLVENAMEGITIVNKEGIVTFTRVSPEPLLGRTETELTGTSGLELVHPDDMPEVINVLNQLIGRPGAVVRTKVRIKHKNGSYRILEAIARNLVDNPAVEGIVVNYRDITEREQAHEQLLKHTKRIEALHAIAQTASRTLELEELLDTALAAIIEVMNADVGGIYLIDMAQKELVLKTYSGLSEESANRVAVIKLNEDTAQKLLQWKDASKPLEEIFDESALKVIKKVSEKERILSSTVVPFAVKGRFCGLLAVGNRSQRTFGSDDLELLSAVGSQIGISVQNAVLFAEVRALVRETLNAQEAERERICLEVHDGVAQSLVSAFQYLQTLEASISDTDENKQLLDKTATQIKRAIQESRDIINSLQPATLNELGLVATLRQEMRNLKKETGLKVEFKADDVRLPRDIETGLYRIIHEAVANARKHSNTKQLRIKIQSENDWLQVEVKDWGKGFDQSYLDMCQRRGTGLFSIRKRAELLKGICDIQSKPGQGTTVSVKIPLAGIKI
jgi:PAS domain S-box-containing protein